MSGPGPAADICSWCGRRIEAYESRIYEEAADGQVVCISLYNIETNEIKQGCWEKERPDSDPSFDIRRWRHYTDG